MARKGVFAAAVAGLLATACSAGGPSSKAPAGGSSAPAATAPARGAPTAVFRPLSWSAAAVAGAGSSGSTDYSKVACAPLGFCMAVVNDAYVTYDGGQWSSPQPIGGNYDSSVSGTLYCASADTCYALTDSGIYPYSGGSWGQPVPLGPIGQSGAPFLSCASVSFCLVTNGQQWAVFDGRSLGPASSTGQPGLQPSGGNDPFYEPEAMSCVSSRSCTLFLSGPASSPVWAATTFNGSSWTAVTKIGGLTDSGDPPGHHSISCVAGRWCMAVEGRQAVAFNGSSSAPPASLSLPAPASGLLDVSCPALGACVAVDNGPSVFSYSAGSWGAAQVVLGGEASFVGVSCASVSLCAAVDDHGEVLVGRPGT